jgi:hypothetical protein
MIGRHQGHPGFSRGAFFGPAFYACATAGCDVSRLLTHLDDHYALYGESTVAAAPLAGTWPDCRGRNFRARMNMLDSTAAQGQAVAATSANWALRTGWRCAGRQPAIDHNNG